MAMLSVSNLNVAFKLPDGRYLRAVRGVDFEVEEGECLGLVGESGCGKTTALLALMGLLPQDAWVSGEVLLDGKPVLSGGESAMRPHRWRDVAMVFQGSMNALNPVKTCGWQIAEPMRVHGIGQSRQSRFGRVRELLELVGLPGEVDKRYPHELSGGMRQRVVIAMALACNPKVLLADEPTTALDVMTQAQILGIFTTLKRELGLALVFVTHDLPIVARVAERTAVMYAGRITEQGRALELSASPRHPYTYALFASELSVGQRRKLVLLPGGPPRLDVKLIGCSFQPRCNRALECCTESEPMLREVGADRLVACHLADSSRSGDDSVNAEVTPR